VRRGMVVHGGPLVGGGRRDMLRPSRRRHTWSPSHSRLTRGIPVDPRCAGPPTCAQGAGRDSPEGRSPGTARAGIVRGPGRHPPP
jgi:hypothetical protein